MSEQMSNSQRARAAFGNRPAERDPSIYYTHTWTELVRAGFWLSVGALIVFPVVMFIVGVVIFFVLGAIGYSL